METVRKVATVLPSADKMLKAKNQLASDFNALVSDAEELLASTAAYSGETISGARSRFKDTLDQFKTRVSDAQSSAVERMDRAAAMTQEYARDNPWKVAGVAALAGVILGALLLNNRR
jgi:ElaB/YqjD/DUF883 family membrane-anchored ribosome-binding protein